MAGLSIQGMGGVTVAEFCDVDGEYLGYQSMDEDQLDLAATPREEGCAASLLTLLVAGTVAVPLALRAKTKDGSPVVDKATMRAWLANSPMVVNRPPDERDETVNKAIVFAEGEWDRPYWNAEEPPPITSVDRLVGGTLLVSFFAALVLCKFEEPPPPASGSDSGDKTKGEDTKPSGPSIGFWEIVAGLLAGVPLVLTGGGAALATPKPAAAGFSLGLNPAGEFEDQTL